MWLCSELPGQVLFPGPRGSRAQWYTVPWEQHACESFRIHFPSNAQLPGHSVNYSNNNNVLLLLSTCLLFARNWNWKACLDTSQWEWRFSSTSWDLAEKHSYKNNWSCKSFICTSEKKNSLLGMEKVADLSFSSFSGLKYSMCPLLLLMGPLPTSSVSNLLFSHLQKVGLGKKQLRRKKKSTTQGHWEV